MKANQVIPTGGKCSFLFRNAFTFAAIFIGLVLVSPFFAVKASADCGNNNGDGTIIIKKKTVPGTDHTTEFHFTSNVIAFLDFDLLNGEQKEIVGVSAFYLITEQERAGWFISNITCEVRCSAGAVGTSLVSIGKDGLGDPPSGFPVVDGFDPGDNSVAICLAPGDTVTCEFTNTQINPPPPPPRCGDGIINQTSEQCEIGHACAAGFTCNDCRCEAIPPPPPRCGDGIINQTFEQCEIGHPCGAGFTCHNCECQANPPTPICGDGIFNQGFEQCEIGHPCGAGFTCIGCLCAANPPNPTCGDRIINQASEECDDGPSGSATCTANCFLLRGTINISKTTVPQSSGGTFHIDVSWNASGIDIVSGSSIDSVLIPGTYSVSEVPPADWILTSIVCKSSFDQTTYPSDNIVLRPLDIVVCTVTNTAEPGTIVFQKVTDPVSDTQTVFQFNTTYLQAPVSLTNGGSRSDSLLPGIYGITELPTADWTLTSTVCTSSLGGTENVSAILLQSNETVTCVFTNTFTTSCTCTSDQQCIDESQGNPEWANICTPPNPNDPNPPKKITICHVDPDNEHSLCVSEQGRDGHQNGIGGHELDYDGPCLSQIHCDCKCFVDTPGNGHGNGNGNGAIAPLTTNRIATPEAITDSGCSSSPTATNVGAFAAALLLTMSLFGLRIMRRQRTQVAVASRKVLRRRAVSRGATKVLRRRIHR